MAMIGWHKPEVAFEPKYALIGLVLIIVMHRTIVNVRYVAKFFEVIFWVGVSSYQKSSF